MISYYVVPKINNLFKDRDDIINSNLLNAENLSAKAKSLQEAYDKEIQNIHLMVEANKQNTLLIVQASFEARQQSLSEELKKIVEHNLKEINVTKDYFWSNAKVACLSLAAEIIEKIINEKPDMALLEKSYGKVK
jgi:F0F1-type ATP synthase membrane subunit b/b'